VANGQEGSLKEGARYEGQGTRWRHKRTTHVQFKVEKGGKIMGIGKRRIGLAIVTILLLGMWLLDLAPQAAAETLNFKVFNHVTKSEMFPIAGAEGHVMAVSVREGTAVLESGDLGWCKATIVADMVKGAGPLNGYSTCALLDGSTFTARVMGTMEATPQGVPSVAKLTGDIIHGTGRFQGIKGTMTLSSKFLPPEKGEYGGKSLGETTLSYTLPSK
jgi:hypothetical protein